MADAKISALTAYTTPLDADLLAIVDTANATTKKITWASVKTALVKTETKTDNYTVQTTDIGKTLVMNVATTAKTFTLPSVGSGDVGLWFTFAKINTGKLTIDAADSDKISDSGAGDTIYNDQTGEVYATITLKLISETQWAVVGADGIWITTD